MATGNHSSERRHIGIRTFDPIAKRPPQYVGTERAMPTAIRQRAGQDNDGAGRSLAAG